MNSDRFAVIAELFDAVVDLPASERAARLQSLSSDRQLITEVAAMLAADARAADFDAAAQALREDAVIGVAGRELGLPEERRFGPWRSVRVLGQGGMGEVLLVERVAAGFEQQGALKLIRRGLNSALIVARFLRERQLLARLDHPNIARLLDGGVAENGQPYFVMEHVDGAPLLEWCSENARSCAERLALFVQICDAVAFAHRQLIVHRDLKPSNILVTRDGRAKLLDFGIAKLIASETADVIDTDTGAGMLTPQYASPEQLRGQPVSTVTDVYGLGTVLYEMLSGQRPYSIGPDRSPLDWLKMLEGAECIAPSKAAERATPSLPPVPINALRGDLDTIALTALQREPSRRYASVDALRDDVVRCLGNLPIRARRDDWRYRTGKFVQRHRVATSIVALTLLALLTTTALAVRSANQAITQAARAEATQAFLVGLFDASDPDLAAGGYRMSARDLVSAGAGRINQQYAAEPALNADLALVLGRIQLRLGDSTAAIAQLSWEDRQPTPLPNAAQRLPTRLAALSAAYATASDNVDSEQAAQRLLKLADAQGNLLQRSIAQRLLSNSAGLKGDRDRALAMSAAALGNAERAGDWRNLVETLLERTAVLREGGDLLAATQTAVRAASLCAEHTNACATDGFRARLEVAGLHRLRGDVASAETQLRAILPLLDAALPANHPYRTDTIGSLAAIASERGHHREAIGGARKALALLKQAQGSDTLEVGGYQNMLGNMLARAGQRRAALAEYRRALTTYAALGLGEHPFTITAMANITTMLDELGDPSAEDHARQTLLISRKVNGEQSASTASRLFELARVIDHHGRVAESLSWYQQALQLSDATPTMSRARRVEGLISMADAFAHAGQTQHAAALFERALALCTEGPTVDNALVGLTQAHYASALRLADRLDEAERLARTAITLNDRLFSGDEDWRPGFARLVLGEVLAARKSASSEAQSMLAEAMRRLEIADGADGVYTQRARLALQELK